MTENDIKAELSYAYLHAVAARAGFGCEVAGRQSDNAGVDALLRINQRLDPASRFTNFLVEVQLKATSQELPLREERYSYWLDDVRRYDRLREASSPLPKLLVVLSLPEDSGRWLELSADGLVARRCAYWVSLLGAPPSSNRSGQTVYLPREQMLTPESLRTLAVRFSRAEEIHHVP